MEFQIRTTIVQNDGEINEDITQEKSWVIKLEGIGGYL